MPAPAAFAPGYYFRQALEIARFDDAAITRASRDPNALLYGASIWLLGQFLIFAALFGPRIARTAEINWFLLAFQLTFLVFFDAVFAVVQYGICHLLARWWFGARGTYLGVLRALLLGSIVSWLLVIPVVGSLVAGLWSIAVLMRVFEEVDGIERMKAFGLASVVGATFWILTLWWLTPKR